LDSAEEYRRWKEKRKARCEARRRRGEIEKSPDLHEEEEEEEEDEEEPDDDEWGGNEEHAAHARAKAKVPAQRKETQNTRKQTKALTKCRSG
jgi:hypothetical protein